MIYVLFKLVCVTNILWSIIVLCCSKNTHSLVMSVKVLPWLGLIAMFPRFVILWWHALLYRYNNLQRSPCPLQHSSKKCLSWKLSWSSYLLNLKCQISQWQLSDPIHHIGWLGQIWFVKMMKQNYSVPINFVQIHNRHSLCTNSMPTTIFDSVCDSNEISKSVHWYNNIHYTWCSVV